MPEYDSSPPGSVPPPVPPPPPVLGGAGMGVAAGAGGPLPVSPASSCPGALRSSCVTVAPSWTGGRWSVKSVMAFSSSNRLLRASGEGLVGSPPPAPPVKPPNMLLSMFGRRSCTPV